MEEMISPPLTIGFNHLKEETKKEEFCKRVAGDFGEWEKMGRHDGSAVGDVLAGAGLHLFLLSHKLFTLRSGTFNFTERVADKSVKKLPFSSTAVNKKGEKIHTFV